MINYYCNTWREACISLDFSFSFSAIVVAILVWRFVFTRPNQYSHMICPYMLWTRTWDLWLLGSSFSDALLSLALRFFLSFLSPFSFSGSDVSAMTSSEGSASKVSTSRLTYNGESLSHYRRKASMIWRSSRSPCGYDINTLRMTLCNDTYKREILHGVQWICCGNFWRK